MLPDAFKRMLESFADSPADLDLSRGRLIVQVRDELIEARLFQQEGDLWVNEAGEERRAISWLIKRIARLPLLSERILTYIPEVEHFVSPSARLLDQPDYQIGDEESAVSDAVGAIRELLSRKLGGVTSVTYLTSSLAREKRPS